MGHIKEPKGIELVVDKKPLDSETENRIRKFIENSKKEIRNFSINLKKHQKNNTCQHC